MRVTVCQLPHHPPALEAAWKQLGPHLREQGSDWLLLPEFAGAEPVWLAPDFDAAIWQQQADRAAALLDRLPELGVRQVVGARPVTEQGRAYNEGFLWSADRGYQRLRRKFHLPDEDGGWEARWFERGDAQFPTFDAAGLRFGLNICTELWALDTYAGYAAQGVQAVLSPRATAAATTDKWLALGTVAAVRSGAYSLSSNRVHEDGSCGGVGWVIDPDGRLLARTSADQPFATVEIDQQATARARHSYPRYVFAAPRVRRA